MTASVSALKPKFRIQSLDILRGFALLGVALVNVLGFNASFFDFGGFYHNLPDPIQQNFYFILIGLTADKFIFLYSFLFGYGFYLQYQKYDTEGHQFTNYYLRRLFFLALFGVSHVVFLWAGDILLTYAFAGLLLFFLRKLPGQFLLLIGFGLYFFISIWLVLSIWIPLPNALSSTCTECLDDALIIYPTGNYFEILKLRLYEYFAFRNINLLYYLPKVMGILIFGFLASQNKLHEKISVSPKKWMIVFAIMAGISVILYFYYESLVFKLLPADSNYINALFMGAYELMNLFMAISYILLIILLSTFRFNILKPLIYVGRMSLTNYIMQSVLFSIVFYGWGFGKFGMKEPLVIIWYAIGIFVVQLILSYFWLKNKKQGPLEWLWRKLAYRNQ